MNNLTKYSIILASGSPRRKQLLQDLDIQFRTIVLPGIKEEYPTTLEPEEIPVFLSKLKAEAHKNLITGNELIITADTVVISDNQVLGKPKDAEAAREMLNQLSGKVHKVVTGVTIMSASKIVTFDATTDVEFSILTPDEIDYYISKYKPFDKAGAYGIQEWIGCIGIKNIQGSFYNVMGLPLQRLYTELKAF